jgi:hypothetical protein
MQRIEMIGLPFERTLIQRARFFELPLLMQCERLMKLMFAFSASAADTSLPIEAIAFTTFKTKMTQQNRDQRSFCLSLV